MQDRYYWYWTNCTTKLNVDFNSESFNKTSYDLYFLYRFNFKQFVLYLQIYNITSHKKYK